MTIALVTGASGFIGGGLIGKLRAAKIDVVEWSGRDIDLRDAAAVAAAMARIKPDRIFHLASSGVASTSAHDPHVIRDDLAMMVSLVAAAPRGSRLICAGSMSEYGHAGLLAEGDCCRPTTAYGIAKLACTHYALAYALVRGVAPCIARLFGVYGPGEKPVRLFPAVLAAAEKGDDVALSDGMQARDFIHVDDACDALIALSNAPTMPDIVNIGTGEAVRVRDVVEWMADAAGAPRTLLRFGAHPRSPGDQDLLVADVARLRNAIGTVPPQRLKPGLSIDLFRRR